MAETTTYDAKKVIIAWGSHRVTEVGEGTFVKASRSKDAFSTKTGADGAMARSKSRDKSGTIEVTVLAISPSNAYFLQMARADELNDTGIQPLTVKDLNGNLLAKIPEAWIQKVPDIEFADVVGERTWVFAGKLDVGTIDATSEI